MINFIDPEQYRDFEAISGTGMVALAKSVPHYLHYLDTPKDETEAMLMGTLFHKAILQPGEFNEFCLMSLAVKPEGMSFATKEGKAWKAEAEMKNQKIISSEGLNKVGAMTASLQANSQWKILSKLIGESAKTEIGLTAIDPMYSTPLKGRIDCLLEYTTENILLEKEIRFLVVDLKTARPPVYPQRIPSTATDEIKAKILNRFFLNKFISSGYDIQLRHYCNLVEYSTGKKCDAMIIAVENEPPFGVAPFYRMFSDGAVMKQAQGYIDRALFNWNNYQTTRTCEQYPVDIIDIDSVYHSEENIEGI